MGGNGCFVRCLRIAAASGATGLTGHLDKFGTPRKPVTTLSVAPPGETGLDLPGQRVRARIVFTFTASGE